MIILINHDQYQLVLTGQMFFKCIDLNISESTSKSSSVFFLLKVGRLAVLAAAAFTATVAKLVCFILAMFLLGRKWKSQVSGELY